MHSHTLCFIVQKSSTLCSLQVFENANLPSISLFNSVPTVTHTSQPLGSHMLALAHGSQRRRTKPTAKDLYRGRPSRQRPLEIWDCTTIHALHRKRAAFPNVSSRILYYYFSLPLPICATVGPMPSFHCFRSIAWVCQSFA